MAGKGKKVQKLIDDETLVFLTKQRAEDTQISININIDQHVTEFRFEHAERFNNFQTDELYIEQANAAEALFLEKMHDAEKANLLARHSEDAASHKAIFEDQRTFNNVINEMKSLTVQCAQNKAAAERMKRAKQVLKERRAAVSSHLARIEARQERERKSLAESQKRHLKQMKLVRGVILRDVEDPEIRIILSGQDFNAKTLEEENAKTDASKAEADKKFHALVLAQLVINTKEIEFLREEHLVHHKYASRYCERELEIIDENEALLFEHTAKEQKLEATQKAQIDSEEDRISIMVATAQAHQAELKVKSAANAVREAQRKEAYNLKRQQLAEKKQREDEFWQSEEEHLRTHLAERKLEDKFDALKAEFLARKHDISADILGMEDDGDDEEIKLGGDSDSNIEAMRARELALLEGLKKEHKNALKRMKAVHLKIREQTRMEQQKSLKAILSAKDADIESLKSQQATEMEMIKEQHSTSKSTDENKNHNDRMYALLPKPIAETLKSGGTVVPKVYENLTFLSAEIADFAAIRAKSTPSQIIALVNRLYSAMDEALDGYEDMYKIDMSSDSYTLVGGVGSDGKNAKGVASNIVSAAITFVNVAKQLDMSDQVVEHVQIKIGVHSGNAVGGVANPALPKFSLLGDATDICSVLESTSKPNGVHVSATTADLVKDKFECDVSESINYSTGGKTQRIPTFWVNTNTVDQKKSRKAARGVASQ